MRQLPCIHTTVTVHARMEWIEGRVETNLGEQKVDAHGKAGASGQYKYINKSNK